MRAIWQHADGRLTAQPDGSLDLREGGWVGHPKVLRRGDGEWWFSSGARSPFDWVPLFRLTDEQAATIEIGMRS